MVQTPSRTIRHRIGKAIAGDSVLIYRGVLRAVAFDAAEFATSGFPDSSSRRSPLRLARKGPSPVLPTDTNQLHVPGRVP